MNLREWAAQHPEIIAEAANRTSVTALFSVLAREISDAEGVPSDDGRLEHSFAACLTAARAALAACGYRIRSGGNHHFLAIESLQYTLGLPEGEVSQKQKFRRMRSRAMYDLVGVASYEDAQAALTAARRLREQLTAWLTAEHPDISPQ
jgi:hypothetical protein